MKKPTTSDADVLRIAAEAACDPRTVRRYLDGDHVYKSTAEHVRRAMQKLGMKGARP